jgi:hypothetical protein
MGMKVVDNNDDDGCVVHSLHENGQAKRYGVRENDEIFYIPDNAGNASKIDVCLEDLSGISSKQMKNLSLSPHRPIKFIIRRHLLPQDKFNQSEIHNTHFAYTNPTEIKEKEENLKPQNNLTRKDEIEEKEENAKLRNNNVIHHTEIKEKKENPKLRNILTKKDKIEEKEDNPILRSTLTKNEIQLALEGKRFPITPSCKKCNSMFRDVKFHHHLCPKHQDFDSSGARDKLVIILAGVRDKCQACIYEFETGRKSSGKHTNKCGRSHISDSQSARSKRMKTSNQKKHTKTDVSKVKYERRKESNVSTYKRRSKKVVIEKEDVDKIRAKKRSYLMTKKAPLKKSITKKAAEVVDVVPVTPTIYADSTPKPFLMNENPSSLCLTDDTSIAQWVSCPNPWGDRVHGDGDFVLMSPACYKSAHEVQGTNPQRFILNPFQSDSSQYNKTHKSPSEGYRVLQLTRDALALRSWGFTFTYHDFGSACLVTEVEPLSPAESAVRKYYLF